MVEIVPFKAVRPEKDKVALVVSRAYEDYSEEELNALLRYNPYSFLHIINPGFRFQQNLEGEQRFTLVRNRYLEFKDNGVLIQDPDPCFYVYRLKTRKHLYYGFFGAASVADYREGRIRKHENTISHREKLFKEYLETVGFNAEPVLLTYPFQEDTDQLLLQVMQETPEYHFSTTNKQTHELWRISDPSLIQRLKKNLGALECLYIADGHHRTASSDLLAESRGFQGQENYFMSFFIADSMLNIYEYNRLVKDLNGLSKQEFLIRLDNHFRIENLGGQPYKPGKKHHFSMYLDGEFYSLYLRKSYPFPNALSALDAQLLYDTVLNPILGIEDLRNDQRIDYGYGPDNIMNMKTMIDKGIYTVGFNLFPVAVEELKQLADEQFTMPPKSTYIEPKLTSGLTIYEF